MTKAMPLLSLLSATQSAIERASAEGDVTPKSARRAGLGALVCTAT